MKARKPQPTKPEVKRPVYEGTVNLQPKEVKLSFGQMNQVGNALNVFAQITLPNFQFVQKIGLIRKAISDYLEMLAEDEQRLVTIYAEKDKNGEYVKTESGDFRISSPHYHEERLKTQREVKTISLPTFTFEELAWLDEVKIGEQYAAALIVMPLMPIIEV